MYEIDSLLHLETFIHYLIDASPDPTFTIDIEGRVTVWNHTLEKLTGVLAADIVGCGNYAPGRAIYHSRRPILADVLMNPEIEQESMQGFSPIIQNRWQG